MATLHELTQEMRSLLDILESIEDEEIPSELQEAVSDILSQKQETEKQTHTKIDGYVGLIRHLEANEAEIDIEIERLKTRKKAITTKRQYLQNRLFQFMQLMNWTKLKTTFNSLSIRKASVAPLIVKCDPKILPDEFKRVTVEADKQAIKDAIKRGDESVKRFAEFGEKSSYLSIR